MSNILDLYQKSAKNRVKEARSIPDQAVNFIDRDNTFQEGWTNNQSLRKTTFTDSAMQHYDEERKQMVTPESFQPVEDGVPLNRYAPGQGYYNPGAPQS